MVESKRDLRKSVEQRLEFIEFRLAWEGMIRRKDLMDQFDISTPQASTDLALYQEQAPNNVIYNSSRKAYVPTKEFQPRFLVERPASDYLALLRSIADGIVTQDETWLGWLPPFESVPIPRRRASPVRLRKILSAVRDRLDLYIQYQSISKPKPAWRWIAPHGLGFDGYRWHVRAWCYQREAYRDFVLSRMTNIDRERDSSSDPNNDSAWKEKIIMNIIPNPSLSEERRTIVALDYGMKEMKYEFESRICLSYYVIKHLGLDLHRFGVPPERQQVVLSNMDEVMEAQERHGIHAFK